MPSINRRDLIASLLGLSAVTTAGCSVSEATPVVGDLLSPDFETGHRLTERILSHLPSPLWPFVVMNPYQDRSQV